MLNMMTLNLIFFAAFTACGLVPHVAQASAHVLTHTYYCVQSPNGNDDFSFEFEVNDSRAQLSRNGSTYESKAGIQDASLSIKGKTYPAFRAKLERWDDENPNWDPTVSYLKQLARGRSGWAVLQDGSGT